MQAVFALFIVFTIFFPTAGHTYAQADLSLAPQLAADTSREVIFWQEPFYGGVYRVVVSEPFEENGEQFCGLAVEPMPREIADDYPNVLARVPDNPVKIVIFPANSEEPLHFWELIDRYETTCPFYEDMTVPQQ